jgi:hypothetical protein|tara:strand:+ start:38 stop:349 length:312 start_codon:yes stop_codon:yes gene_type:complete
MTHTYKILKTKHNEATGVITKITYSLVSQENDDYWYTKLECNCSGGLGDEGFVPFNDLTQADLENIIDKYEVKSQIEATNSASLATYVEAGSPKYSEGLPPNV